MGKPVDAAYDQDAFRGRTNVADPSGVNAAYDPGDAAINTNWTQLVDVLFRLRYVIQQTVANANAGLTPTFSLQFNRNGTGWVAVGAQGAPSVAVRYADAAGFADADNTTQLLGGGSFVTGDGVEVDPSDTITFTTEALSETEVEVALEIVGTEVADGDTIELRVVRDGSTALDSYTNTPSLTVDEPAILAADAGSFALTGTAASLLVGYRLDSEAGAYALTGAEATLIHGFMVLAESGEFVLSGAVADLLAARLVAADGGSYLLSGTDADLLAALLLSAEAGSYALTGQAATLTEGGGASSEIVRQYRRQQHWHRQGGS